MLFMRSTLASALALSVSIPALAMAQDRPTLTFAVDNLWPTMDPVIGISTTGGRVHSNIFETLIQRNYFEDLDGNELIPGLATSWERISPTVWTLQIREGVTFHNGDPMTAEDVAFSLSAERLWGDAPQAPRGASFAKGLVRVEATDDYTVELETEFPDSSFVARLTTPIGFVLPKAYYESVGTDEFGQNPVGTGQYQVVEFDPSTRLVAEAYDDYWGSTPLFSSINWSVISEYSTRYAGLVSGEFDMIVNIPTDQLEAVGNTDGVNLVVSQVGNYPMFAFNTLDVDGMEDNPIMDADLRKAMVMAIDMDTLARALWDDITYTPTPFNFPEYGDYHDPDREATYGYDPERAAEYLARSGYDGETLRWHIVRGFFPNYETAAEFMVEDWAALGVDVEIRYMDNFGLAYERPFHLLNMSMSSEFTGDPYRPLWLDWGPGSNRVIASHRTWVPTDGFLEAGERFARAQEFEDRHAAYLDLVAEWEDVTPAMYMWRNVQSFAMRDGLEFDPGSTQVTVFDDRYVTLPN